jgi:MoaA/NifB/PqqE/SkfB family radical SAM enzyme
MSTLDLSTLVNFLDFGKENDLETVCYSGGDPFCYNRLNEVMEWHLENGVDYGFITSGYVPTWIDLSLLAQARWIRVSLDAVGDELYEVCRGGVSFTKVDKSINDMIDAGCNVCLGNTLHEHNYMHLPDLMEYALDKDIKEVRVWVVRQMDAIVPSDEKLLESDLELYALRLDEAGVDNNLDAALRVIREGEHISFKHCYATYYQLFIGAGGGIYPCCIIAGDTEDKAHMPSFGNIAYAPKCWKMYKDIIDEYNSVRYMDLPPICRSNCIMRLSTINHIAGKHWNDKNFL